MNVDGKEFLVNKTNDIVDNNPKLISIIKEISKYKKYALISLVIGLFFVILGPVAAVYFYSTWQVSKSFLWLLLIVFAIIIVVLGVCALAIYMSFNRKAKNQKLDQAVTDILYENKSIQSVYGEFYYKFIDDEKTDNFEIKIVRRIPKVEVYESSYKNWLSKRVLAINNNTQNSFHFTYKDKKVSFFIKNPKKFIEYYYSTDSKGNTTRHEKINFISNAAVFMENTKFDESYNGLRVVQEKDPKKGLFQTDSIEFNKRFYINANDNDLRAAKFLSPRLIEKLSSIEVQNIYSVGIENEIYADWFQVKKNSYVHDVCAFDTHSVYSIASFKKMLIDKITQDFYLFEHLFNCVRAVY
ncbi:hypothetical protein SGLAD_v1c02630 [Spiroplasma gladiatoris]|uniref:DUF3137 domain-containing protein n=1 Tax=Spiroplasma gladiatoris TaxID=2143 RepID=A0A4P7AH21_9MOLU|nr:DUF308 domain-containing protein [Spiroplasma gladiatoris]QBQ07462.1 hypothetical protein SGLAD_v1c02630 [Spiroplasma gladiatoris]